MGKSLEKLAFDLIVQRPFCISKKIAAARKWDPKDVPQLSGDDILEIAEMQRRRETYQLEIKVPLVCEALADPRIIDTAKGPWDVLDISLPDGSEHLLSLGHTVLKKRIAERMPIAGKKLVIMALGKRPGKRYYDYVVMTLEEWQATQEWKKAK